MDTLILFWNHGATVLWLIPIVGIITLLLSPSSFSLGLGLIVSTLTFVFCCTLGFFIDFSTTGPKLTDVVTWMPQLGIFYRVFIDGMSFPFILIISFLFFMIHLTLGIREGIKGFVGLLLLLEASMLSIFISLDLVQFLTSWIITITAIYFLHGTWKKVETDRSHFKFIIWMGISTALLLAAIGMLTTSNSPTIFNFSEFLNVKFSSETQKILVFWVLLMSFSIMSAIFPFHTWFLDIISNTSAALRILLSSGFLFIGFYGFVKILIPLFPEFIFKNGAYISIGYLIHFVYGCLSQLSQVENEEKISPKLRLRSIGLCILGLLFLATLSFRVEALHGAYLLMISYSLLTVLFYGFPRTLNQTGVRVSSYWALSFAPAFSLFTATLFIFLGLFQSRPIFTTIVLMGSLLYIISIFWMYQKHRIEHESASFYEMALAWILLTLLLVMGIYPQSITTPIYSSVDSWIGMVQAR